MGIHPWEVWCPLFCVYHGELKYYTQEGTYWGYAYNIWLTQASYDTPDQDQLKVDQDLNWSELYPDSVENI